MKFLAEQRGKKITLIVLIVLAFATLVRGFLQMPGAPSATPAAASKHNDSHAHLTDPHLDISTLEASRQVIYQKQGPPLFGAVLQAAAPGAIKIEKPSRSPLMSKNKPLPPVYVEPGPPPKPSIDLKYFGQATNRDGKIRAFLSHGANVYVVQEGELIERRYRILRVTMTSVEVEDLFYDNRATLPLRKS